MITLVVSAVVLAASLIGIWATSPVRPPRQVFTRADGLEIPACPVGEDEGPINLAVRTVLDDGPVFLGCPDCVEKLRANPKMFAAKIVEQQKVLEAWPRIQVTCPVSGETIDKRVFVEYAGAKVYLCGERCKSSFQAAPWKYKVLLAASYSYQTKCPVDGKEIDPAVSTKAPGGETVYFCADTCCDKFDDGPAQYASKLADQGFWLDLPSGKP